MMDAYSYYPQPSLEERITDVVNNFNDEDKDIIQEHATKIVPTLPEFSYTGWIMFGVKDAVKLVSEHSEIMPKNTFKP